MKATVEVTHGNKGINRFLQSAGLGLTGAYTTERWVISYAEGEEVTPERVEAAMRSVQEAANADPQVNTEILRFSVVSISTK